MRAAGSPKSYSGMVFCCLLCSDQRTMNETSHDPAQVRPHIESETKGWAGQPKYERNKTRVCRARTSESTKSTSVRLRGLRASDLMAAEGRGFMEAAYEIHLGEWQEAPPRDFLRVVLRANRRNLSARAHHASLLLHLRVLPRSLQARHLGT